jgi:predicted methyltransferase
MQLQRYFVAFALALGALTCHAGPIDLRAPGRPVADLTRDITSKPVETLAMIKLAEGATVLDLLGGNGYFSELAAQQVGPTGKVLLHNNAAYHSFVGKAFDERMGSGRLKNVVRYDREVDQLGLADNSVDAVLFVMGYHDMYHVGPKWKIDPKNLMGQVRAALKPGGLMLVIDHSAPVGSKLTHSQDNHRIDIAYVKDELRQFGFEPVSESDVLANPQDNRLLSVFDPAIRGKTDRFLLVVRNKK